MGRPLRVNLGGYVYHCLNRGNGRAAIFRKDADYEAFERILAETHEHVPGMRLVSYCLMPNHWHLVLWPRRNGELSDYLHWLTLTHTQRWHAHSETWIKRTATRLGLESSLRSRGRPRQAEAK